MTFDQDVVIWAGTQRSGNMKYYVYILRSAKDAKRYVGMTNDIKRRLYQHNKGLVKATKNRLPLELKHITEFPDRPTARQKERYYKTAAGRRYLDGRGI